MSSSTAAPRIRFIIPWFGPWPAWMQCFLESCRWNPSIDWLLVSDSAAPDDLPPNVQVAATSQSDYFARVATCLGIKTDWSSSYKLCDLKPCLGLIHETELAGYDYWAFGDMDVIYGDISRFLTPEVLNHDLITTHAHVVAGHFTVLRNTPRMRSAFKRIPFWRNYLSTDRHRSFDEQVFSRLFLPIHGRGIWRRLITPKLGGAYFQECFSTNLSSYLKWIDGTLNFPTSWFWDRGHLTTDRSGEREFLYLHFSHWQSNRWTSEPVAPWKRLMRLVDLPPGRPAGFTISRDGFTPLPQPAAASLERIMPEPATGAGG